MKTPKLITGTPQQQHLLLKQNGNRDTSTATKPIETKWSPGRFNSNIIVQNCALLLVCTSVYNVVIRITLYMRICMYRYSDCVCHGCLCCWHVLRFCCLFLSCEFVSCCFACRPGSSRVIRTEERSCNCEVHGEMWRTCQERTASHEANRYRHLTGARNHMLRNSLDPV